MLPNLFALRAEAQRNLLEFLETDLALCFTFSDLVYTELHKMEDREAALQVNAKAERGYESIAHLLLRVEDETKRDALQQRLTELRARLDGLQGHFRSSG